ncbi:HAD family hydrolase [Paenibacillus sp. 19GGS1-52]|uniref:HAD family hydrolase n=1 Tax=Paenibacillus sp. 19GGS1-52 TaxID=2758563 RepID=UPI001EFB8433|nr:HAD family hydrolase [Paenibacillus sp. 19GGS1-52]ULO05535.1 HAD family hydrolase [Paenibacillus sp. 19GGS1-52]
MKVVIHLKELESSKRAVFFDVDDTLYSQFALTKAALHAVLKLPDTFPYEQAYFRIGQHSERLSLEGNLLQVSPHNEQSRLMREQRFIDALAEFGISISQARGAEIQQHYTRLQEQMMLFEGAEELLGKLLAKDYVVGIITNGNEEHQWKKIRTLGLERYIPIERIFISGAVGYTKPDPRIFQLANEQTETAPRNCIYIGDSWQKDIAGANAAGWSALWFNPLSATSDSNYEPYAVVSSYAELAKLLM